MQHSPHDSMIVGRLWIYAGLVLPVFWFVSNGNDDYKHTELTSIQGVAYLLLAIWFLAAIFMAVTDVRALLKDDERDAELEEDAELEDIDFLPQTHPHHPVPSPVTSSVRREQSPAPAVTPPFPYPGNTEPEEDPPEESSAAPSVPPTRISVPTLSAEAPAPSGSKTLQMATDPTLPWPAPWNETILDSIRNAAREKSYVPLYLGVTRWNAQGAAFPGTQIAPIVHRVFPGSMGSVLIAGSTDSGKSVIINTMILTAAMTHGPDTFVFEIAELDAKGVNFQAIAQLPHCRGISTNPVEAKALAARVFNEHRRRTQLFEYATQQTGGQIDDLFKYNRAVDSPLPIYIVVIDELRTFMVACGSDDASKKGTFATQLVERMAYAMRKTGIITIMATQYPLASVLPRTASTQIGTVVSMRLNDGIQTRVVFGDGTIPYQPEQLPVPDPDPAHKRYAGRCIIRKEGQFYLAQAAAVPDLAAITQGIIQQYPPREVSTEPAYSLLVE